MKLKINTGIKLGLSFGFVILLTFSIVLASFFSLNLIENKSNDYKFVINAQKDLLKANLCMESYLNERDSLQYTNCSNFLNSAIHSFDVLMPRLNNQNLPLLDTLFLKLNLYKELMQQNFNAITKQNEIYGNRRKMRVIFTEESKKSHISRESNLSYYFNQARLNAVYLLSSNEQTYYNETKEYVGLALIEAKKMNNLALIKALDDYMVSVKDNYELALKIKITKNAQIILGREILETSDNMINNISAYQDKVRKSTKIFMFIFSATSVTVSIIISQFVVVNLTRSRRIIENKN